LSPVCGFEVLITPKPQATCSTFAQKLTPVIRMASRVKPGLRQHSSLIGQLTFVLLGVHPAPEQLSQPPWMAGHFPQVPQAMQTLCSQRGKLVSAVTLKTVVLLPVASVKPPASTQGVVAHVPAAEPAPQSESTAQEPNVFVLSVAWVVQNFGPDGAVTPM